MSPKHLIYLITFIVFLAGCGLEPDEDEEAEDRASNTYDTVMEQNPLLPLTVGTSIVYSNDSAETITSSVRINEALSDNDETFYDLTMTNDADSKTLVLQVQSNKSGIFLKGLKGSLLEDYFQNASFKTPINLTEEKNNTTTNLTVQRGNNSVPVTITYSIANAPSVHDQNHEEYGKLPTEEINLTGEIPLVESIKINFEISLSLSNGIGIVSQNIGFSTGINSINSIVAHDITYLVGLPQTIWFDYNDGNPIVDDQRNGGDNFFKIRRIKTDDSTTEITDTKYSVANKNSIATAGWLTIDTNTANSYFVDIKTGSSPPMAGAHSQQIVFEGKDGKQYSGSVVLLVPEAEDTEE